jgi:hypothetical protein
MRERVLGVERFTVDVPQATLDDLAERLARTRWPGDLDGPGWEGYLAGHSLTAVVPG